MGIKKPMTHQLSHNPVSSPEVQQAIAMWENGNSAAAFQILLKYKDSDDSDALAYLGRVALTKGNRTGLLTVPCFLGRCLCIGTMRRRPSIQMPTHSRKPMGTEAGRRIVVPGIGLC